MDADITEAWRELNPDQPEPIITTHHPILGD
jgi:hypothetical protein